MENKFISLECKKKIALGLIGLHIIVLIICLVMHAIHIKTFNDALLDLNIEFSVPYMALFGLFSICSIVIQLFGLYGVYKENRPYTLVYVLLATCILLFGLVFGIFAANREIVAKRSRELILIVPFALLNLCPVGLYVHCLVQKKDPEEKTPSNSAFETGPDEISTGSSADNSSKK